MTAKPHQRTTRSRSLAYSVVTLVAALTIVSCDQSPREVSAEDRIHPELPAEPIRTTVAASDPSRTAVPASDPSEGISGIPPHQHEAQHGGVVRSVDVYHVEVAQNPLEIWLYDRRGHQVPMNDVDGQIVIYADEQRHPYALEVEEQHLVPVESVTLPAEGSAFVELTIGKRAIDVAFELPLVTNSVQTDAAVRGAS